MSDRVRHARTALVKEDQAAELSEASKEGCCLWLLPDQLQVGHPARNNYKVNGTLTEHLVGDVEIAAPGVLGLGCCAHRGNCAPFEPVLPWWDGAPGNAISSVRPD